MWPLGFSVRRMHLGLGLSCSLTCAIVGSGENHLVCLCVYFHRIYWDVLVLWTLPSDLGMAISYPASLGLPPHPCVCCSCLVVSDSLQPHGLQLTRLPCPSLSPRVFSKLCSLNQKLFNHLILYHPFSPALNLSQQQGLCQIGASASTSVLPMNIQNWFPLGLTDLISLLSKGLLSLVQHHNFKASVFSTQPSLWSNSHIHTWLLEKP